MYGDIPLMICKISFHQRDKVGTDEWWKFNTGDGKWTGTEKFAYNLPVQEIRMLYESLM